MAEVHSIEIKVDSTQAQTASRNLDKMSGSANGAESALNNLTRAALGLVALDKIAGVAKGILDTNRAMEALRAQLVSVTGSAIGAQKAFTFIQNFATSTPYEIEGLTKAFITLQNYGIKPTKQVMEAVTNQASKLGGEQQTLEGIVRALGQAYAKGKLQAEEMLQLAERGVPIYDLLSQVTGKNAAQLQDMAQKGELTRDVLERLIGKMGELSSGANAAAMDTLNGKISNLSDAWHQFEDALLNDKSEGIIKSIVDGITSQINRMTAEINRSPVQKLEDQLASLRKTPGYDVPIAEVERQLASAKKAQEDQDKITAEQMKAEDARVAKVEEQRKKLLAGDGAVVKSKKEQTAATKALHEAEAAFSATIDANIRVTQNQAKVQEAQYKTAEKRLNLEMEQAKAAASIRMDTAKTDEDKLRIQEELAAKIESIIVRETELKQEQISLDEKIIATRIAGVEQEIASADRFNLSQAERIRLETELQALKAQEQIIPEERAQLEIDAMLELQNAYGDLNKLKAESADTEAKVRDEALRTLEVLSSNLEYSREMATGLAEAFGEVGAAIGGMSVALAEYDKQSATIEIARTEAIQKAGGDQRKIDEANTTAAKKQATAQIKSYGDMTKAAQGFFKKGTAGYEAMGAASKVFRAADSALDAIAYADKITKMLGVQDFFKESLTQMGIISSANTQKELAETTAKAQAKGVEGAANQGSSGDPYTAFARVAAWIALMASIGVMVGGGGSSAPAVSPSDIAKQNEDAFKKSTATMLGSSEMSTSILDALEILSDNSTNDLDYTKGMARNMELLVGSIASLSTAIATSFNFDVSKLNLGTVSNPRLKHVGLPADPLMSALIGGIIGGTKINRSLIDQGISLVKQTLGEIIDSGVVKAGQYANILVTKTDKALFGMFSSTSQKIERETSKLDPVIKQALGQVLDNAYATLVDAGKFLGKGAKEFEETLKTYTIKKTDLKLGKNAEKNAEKLTAWISSELDRVVEFAAPELKAFKRAGEGLYETSIRVADGVAQAQQELDMLGLSAIKYTDIVSDQKDQIDIGTEITRQTILAQGDLSEGSRKYVEELRGSAKDIAESYAQLASVAQLMRGAGFGGVDIDKTMINAAGGLNSFEEALRSFRENFLTDTQRLNADTVDLAQAFGRLGYELPKSKDEFTKIALVLSQDTTEAGKKLFGQFIKLNEKFSDLTEASKELADAQAEAAQKIQDDLIAGLQKNVDSAFSAMQKAYQDLQKVQERFLNYSKNIRAYLDELTGGKSAFISPEERYRIAKQEFQRISSLVATGDESALAEITKAGKDFLDASREYNASSQQFQDDFASVTGALESSAGYAEAQANIAATQLKIAENNYSALVTINNSTLSVQAAISALTSTMASYASAVSSLAAGKASTGGGGGGGGYAPGTPENPIPVPKVPVVISQPTPTPSYTAPPTLNSAQEVDRFFASLPYTPPQTPDWLQQILNAQGYATGGSMSAGISLVGESGPELISSGGGYVSSAGATANFFKTIKDAVVLTSNEQVSLLKEQVIELQALVRLQSAANRELINQLSEIRSETSEATRIAKIEASA